MEVKESEVPEELQDVFRYMWQPTGGPLQSDSQSPGEAQEKRRRKPGSRQTTDAAVHSTDVQTNAPAGRLSKCAVHGSQLHSLHQAPEPGHHPADHGDDEAMALCTPPKNLTTTTTDTTMYGPPDRDACENGQALPFMRSKIRAISKHELSRGGYM